jgi:hypothetical protein
MPSLDERDATLYLRECARRSGTERYSTQVSGTSQSLSSWDSAMGDRPLGLSLRPQAQ